MEGKDIIRALLWSALIFFAWQIVAVRIWPPQPPVEVDERTADPMVATKSGDVSPGPDKGSQDGSVTNESATMGTGEASLSAGEHREVTIGSVVGGRESQYRMSIELTTRGAAVVGASLSDHRFTPDKDSPPYPMLSTEHDVSGNPVHSFITRMLHVREWSLDIALGAVEWQLVEESQGRAVFSADVIREGATALRVRKSYTLPKQRPDEDRHDLLVEFAIENLTDQPLSAILTESGPVGVHQEDLRFNDRLLFLGTKEGEAISVRNFAMQADKELPMYRDGGGGPIAWTAVANKYFAAFQAPRPQAGHDKVEWIEAVKEIPVGRTVDNIATSTVSLSTKPLAMAAGQTTHIAFDVYLGPKLRKAFQEVEDYARLGYEQQIYSSYSMGPCAFLTPTTLTRFMVWMLNSLKSVVINYGIAIIILVLIVRTILHPVTKKGQVNMMRMQQRMGTLAPKMEEIKKRHPNDKQKQSQEVMKVYQEAGVNPATGMMSSCLPMFLQMPIWMALFTSLNYNIEMRHQAFFWWIRDLTAPDALITFSSTIHIPLISSMTGPINSFNLLPILVSVAMFAQQKMMPKPKPTPGQSSDQAEQAAQMQKMMPYMTLFFGLFFYNMPSGLNLYIGASSFFGTIEQMRIRKHIEEMKNQPPAPPPSSGAGAVSKKPKGPSIIERLQKAAGEAQKLKSNRGDEKRRAKKAL